MKVSPDTDDPVAHKGFAPETRITSPSHHQVDGAEEAAAWFGKALAIEEEHLGCEHVRVSQTLRELGLCTRKVRTQLRLVLEQAGRHVKWYKLQRRNSR